MSRIKKDIIENEKLPIDIKSLIEWWQSIVHIIFKQNSTQTARQ